MSMAVHYSSARTGEASQDEWRTPPEIIEIVQTAMGGITLDPCADEDCTVPALTHYTAEIDGLLMPWRDESVYMNPPYSAARTWVTRFCVEDLAQGVALLPARPGSRWWQMITDHRLTIALVRGRLRFVGAANVAPFPSVLVYRGRRVGRFLDAVRDIADVWIRV